jgi:D-2-hydroxyacid dehydrogenase (NADP+)
LSKDSRAIEHLRQERALRDELKTHFNPSSDQNVLYIGAPEADASAFAKRARADFPGIILLATNDRVVALEQAEHANIIIGHHFQFDDGLLQRARQLRWIQSLTTGTDAIIKLSALRPETLVTSTRGMHGPQMSELVFLHMLALGRDFPRMHRNQATARWERWPQPLLWGRCIVIVGVGAIAESLAPRCKAFGMHVYGVSNAKRVPNGFDAIFGRDELLRAVALADFLVLLVPHSAQTENLIDARVIAKMKPSAFLINVARGGVLDEHALLQALHERRIAGAGLDVFRQQPLPPENPLWRAANVLITPLLGGMSDIYLEQAYPIVHANLQFFLAGQLHAMLNVVPH